MSVGGCQFDDNGQHPCQDAIFMKKKLVKLSNIGLVYTF